MVGQKALTLHVNLASAVNCDNPRENVLYNTLVYLMKNVWCDGLVDIDIGKLFPEGMNNGLYVIVTTIFSELD